MLHGGLHLLDVGDVGDVRGARQAGLADPVEDRRKVLGTDVYADHAGSGGGTLLGDQFAESTAGTGDDDDLVLQVLRHSRPV